jgi:hypothetical protein
MQGCLWRGRNGQSQGLPQNIALYAAPGGAEGHAHAYLLSLLCHGIGDDSIDAEGSKKRAKTSEDGHEQNEETARRDRMIDERLQRTEAARGLRRIEAAERDQDTAGESVRIHSGADDESCAFDVRVLRHRDVDLGTGLLLESAFADVGDDTDDAGRLASGAVREFSNSVLPQVFQKSMTAGTNRSTFLPGAMTAPKSKLAGRTPTMVTGPLTAAGLVLIVMVHGSRPDSIPGEKAIAG